MKRRWARLRGRYSNLLPRWAKERGYVAVMTALLMTTLMGLAAFAVDVGNWYLVGQQEQAAADSAVMAGVTYLPAQPSSAASVALAYSKANDFEHGVNSTTVTASQEGGATRLRVTINRTVTNFFGSLLGMPTTNVGRSAVADFAGPVVMGSPCNEFGNDPDPGSHRSTNCSGVLGAFWANVNSYNSGKVNGDPYQGSVCASTVDGCSGSGAGPQVDYTADGYFYTVSVKSAGMTNLKIELFDPVFVNTGLLCLSTGSPDPFDDDGWSQKSDDAQNNAIIDESTRYRPNDNDPQNPYSSPYCTGDAMLGGSQVMNTQFTVRAPSTSPWDPTSGTVVSGCDKVYPGYNSSLFRVLDQFTSGSTPRSTYNKDSTGTVGPAGQTIVDGFRRWTTLCTIASPVVGDYLIQVKTNGISAALDTANASNHFSMRATAGADGGGSTDKNFITVSGREKMGIYVNAPGAVTGFYLARVPTSAAGQTLRVRLFDVGDSSGSGTIKIIPPNGTNYAGCVGQLGPGPSPAAGAQVALTDCSLTVTNGTHNGKWQSIAVPIPVGYTCTDSDQTACWVKLQYTYGAGNQPNDVTAWTAAIEGDPVRLVE